MSLRLSDTSSNYGLVLWVGMAEYHYKHKEYLMTKNEHHFFKQLVRILGDDYYVFPQVHLGNIIRPKEKWTYRWTLWRGAYFFSDKYSVDYVICDTAGIKPLVVIELDDKSHEREERKNRDKIVERMLAEANLPILRFKNGEINNSKLISNKLNLVLKIA